MVSLALGLARHPRRPRRWAIGAYFEGVSGLTTLGEMHVRRGHYIGVAPVPGGLANACLVVPEWQPGADRSPEAALERPLGSDPQLSRDFHGTPRDDRRAMLGPLAVETTGAGLRGLLLAGDAAGFIDPMTGDGLRLAMRGGELAAAAALEALRARQQTSAPRRLAGAAGSVSSAPSCASIALLRSLGGEAGGVSAAALISPMAPSILQRLIGYAGDVGT